MKDHELGEFSSQTRDRSGSEVDGTDTRKYAVDNLKNFLAPQKPLINPEQAITDLFYGIFDPSQIILTPNATRGGIGNQLDQPMNLTQLNFQQPQGRLQGETAQQELAGSFLDPSQHDHSEICGHLKINYKGLVYYLHNQKLCRTSGGNLELLSTNG